MKPEKEYTGYNPIRAIRGLADFTGLGKIPPILWPMALGGFVITIGYLVKLLRLLWS